MDNKIIANMKSLGIDMISNAKSGHSGIVLSAAPLLYTIYAKNMNINTADPNWINRDRFVLSAGHGSALLYSCLFMAGYNITMEDMKNFRRAGYKTPGHPEINSTPGVDASTGPLGQGIANAVGMALGEKILEEKFKLQSGKPLINYNIYALCGDGDLMEGISYESMSFAGTLNLDNLIIIYDSNNISLDGDLDNTFTENIEARVKSMGWHYEKVLNGNDYNDINRAISNGKKSGKPSFVEVKTIIGQGSRMAGSNKIHGAVLDATDMSIVKRGLNIPEQLFYVDNEAITTFRTMIHERSSFKYELWSRNYKEFVSTASDSDKLALLSILRGTSINLMDYAWEFDRTKREATRVTNGNVLNKIIGLMPNLIGGSADLSSSTKTYLNGKGDIKDEHFDGKNIWFGVREHAMGGILNGLALTNLRPFGSTFLTFSDYLKPAIRMSALMNLPVTYIFTHDSINIGQDGPTHQPIEQLVALRSIPNLNVYRPVDGNEIVGCWNEILNRKGPSALILSRQDVKLLDSTVSEYVKYGAYPIRREKERLHGIIIATGSEVATALVVAEQLYNEYRMDLRVVSMPCMEDFEKCPQMYKERLLPRNVKTFVIEAGSSLSWYKYVYDERFLITTDKFGISGTKDEVYGYFNYTFDDIKERIRKLI